MIQGPDERGPDPVPSDKLGIRMGNGSYSAKDSKKVQLLCMVGDPDIIVDGTTCKGSKKVILNKILDIQMGLSLKGYEGRSVGAIYLLGDIEGIRRNSTQMIINPFKGWKDINIKDDKQLATIESFTQLDGALIIDNRGFIHYAGRMINVSDDTSLNDHSDFRRRKGKGSGTRWRAAKYITTKTKTIAITLSSNGNITVFEKGDEIGRIERRMCSMDQKDIPLYLYPKGNDD
jgi:DNA integrity scanning protein DisA with diadenylate cyclase activity